MDKPGEGIMITSRHGRILWTLLSEKSHYQSPGIPFKMNPDNPPSPVCDETGSRNRMGNKSPSAWIPLRYTASDHDTNPHAMHAHHPRVSLQRNEEHNTPARAGFENSINKWLKEKTNGPMLKPRHPSRIHFFIWKCLRHFHLVCMCHLKGSCNFLITPCSSKKHPKQHHF